MARPRVTLKCVADNYADKTHERIVEFNDGTPGGPGGLISLYRTDTGLNVSVYRTDPGVEVVTTVNARLDEGPLVKTLLSWYGNLTTEERTQLGLPSAKEEA